MPIETVSNIAAVNSLEAIYNETIAITEDSPAPSSLTVQDDILRPKSELVKFDDSNIREVQGDAESLLYDVVLSHAYATAIYNVVCEQDFKKIIQEINSNMEQWGWKEAHAQNTEEHRVNA
jgi:hypothetical protein